MTSPLRVQAVELIEVALPLVRPFRTSFGEERHKRAILLRVLADEAEGWGECVAGDTPVYSGEWIDAAWLLLETNLVRALLTGGPIDHPDDVARRLASVRGNRMAKAGLEAAVLDAWLRLVDRSLSEFLGGVRDRVPCGVSVGIAPTAEDMLEEIEGYVANGYRRVKLKIEPGRDVEVVRAVRARLPETSLSVDANAAYSLDDGSVFEALDEFGLTMIEQPLHHEDLRDHATLQARLRTPICLDESIRSARDAELALDLRACRVINIKPGRVGGLLEARRIHDLARSRDAPVWIGGMLETGVGRAANLAIAALPGVTMPGDTSASDRYFREDLTEPFVLGADGTMAVPAGPGIGVVPVPERLDRATIRRARISPGF
jgi:o-succinylbenzoate synthase